MVEKLDKILTDLVDLTIDELEKTKQRGYFSKDFIEACGIVISLAYNRWSRNDK